MKSKIKRSYLHQFKIMIKEKTKKILLNNILLSFLSFQNPFVSKNRWRKFYYNPHNNQSKLFNQVINFDELKNFAHI